MSKMVLLGGCPSKSDQQSVKKIALFGGCPSRSDLQLVTVVLLGGCPSRNDLQFVKNMVLLGLEAVPAEVICVLSVKLSLIHI